MVARDELDVAELELHVERVGETGFLKDVHGFLLGGGQRGDEVLVAEAREGFDKGGIPSTVRISHLD